MHVSRPRQHARLYRRPLTRLQKADIEREGQRIAEAYEAPGWDEVFSDFDELGRLKPKVPAAEHAGVSSIWWDGRRK